MVVIKMLLGYWTPYKKGRRIIAGELEQKICHSSDEVRGIIKT